MTMNYKPKKKDRVYAFKEIELSNGTVIGVFQGDRGENKDLDILIKYQEDGKRIRTPKHIHWVIDILIKKEHNKQLTLEFIKFLRDMYDNVEPFKSKEDQQRCDLKETVPEKLTRFEPLNQYGEYKVDFIGHLIELMIKMEKNGLSTKPARVFKELMDAMLQEKEIFVIVSKATQGKR